MSHEGIQTLILGVANAHERNNRYTSVVVLWITGRITAAGLELIAVAIALQRVFNSSSSLEWKRIKLLKYWHAVISIYDASTASAFLCSRPGRAVTDAMSEKRWLR